MRKKKQVSEFSPKYKGEPLYHGTPSEIIGKRIKPGTEGQVWATDQPKEASIYGGYKNPDLPTNVYEVKPVSRRRMTGVYGPRLYGGNLVKHFHSGAGFKVVRKLGPEEIR